MDIPSLIAQWRIEAREHRAYSSWSPGARLDQCADELEAIWHIEHNGNRDSRCHICRREERNIAEWRLRLARQEEQRCAPWVVPGSLADRVRRMLCREEA